MKIRTPLLATVVTALLVGGATTGTTLASWTSQAPLQQHSVGSGQMSFTATTPAGVVVTNSSGATADTTLVLDDTSAGKKLTQRITATVGTTPRGVTATVGTTCPGVASVSVDMTPTTPDQTLCVRVTSSTTAVSGNVAINLASAQQPTSGWTTPAITRNVAVTVNATTPAVPLLTCVTISGTSISWTATGSTYNVYESVDNATWPTTPVVAGTSATTFTKSPFPSGNAETRFYRVTAVNAAGASTPSNVIRIRRSGSSANFTCGAPTS